MADCFLEWQAVHDQQSCFEVLSAYRIRATPDGKADLILSCVRIFLFGRFGSQGDSWPAQKPSLDAPSLSVLGRLKVV